MSGKGRVIVIDDEVNAAAALETLLKEDGYEVTRELRRHEATRGMPVILLTARVQEADVQRGIEAGADDYVPKPFSPQELGERVQAALGR